MVIKLTQIIRNLGEIIFVVEYSDNAATKTVNIRKEELVAKLKQVRQLLGRPITLQDVREVIIAIVKELRLGGSPLPEDPVLDSYIGVNLEQ